MASSSAPLKPQEGVERTKVIPTMLIGLGGTGGDVLLRVRKRFFEKYGSLDEFPVVSYLWLDTDVSQKHVIARDFTEAVAFRDPERVMTTIDDCAEIVANLDSRPEFSNIKEWWYPGLNSIPRLNDGAGQIRAYSRLGFFHHFATPDGIENAIRQQGNIIRDPVLRDAMLSSRAVLDAGGVQFDDPRKDINVYVVGSLAGGTGSGMFLDTAFLVKRLHPNAQLVGYLLLPRFFGTETRMDANGYAALKELNYYSTHDFTARWNKNLPPFHVHCPPFSYCYLLDSKNMAGEVVGMASTREAVFEMLADVIFKDFTHGSFADQKRSCRVNIGKDLIYPHAVRRKVDNLEITQEFPVRFQSLGMASIVMPHDRIRTACAYRLGVDVVDYWGGLLQDFPAAALEEKVRTQLLPHPRVALSQDIVASRQRNDILEAVGRESSGGGQIASKLEAWSKDIADRILRGVPAQQRQSYRAFLDNEFEQAKSKLEAEEKHVQPDSWGDYARAVHFNAEALKKQAIAGLESEIQRLVDVEKYSLKHAAALLRKTADVLGDERFPYMVRFERDAQDCLAKLPRAEQRARAAVDELARRDRRSNWDGRKRIILDYDLECWRDAMVGSPREPGYLRLLLLHRIYRAAAGVCRAVIQFIVGEQQSDGRFIGGFADRLSSREQDLQSFRDRLKTRLGHFRDNRPADLSHMLYEARQFDAIYDRYAGKDERRRDFVKQASSDILKRLEAQVSSLPALATGDQAQRIEDAILAYGRDRFSAVRTDYHVVLEFNKAPREQRVEILKRMLRKAQPLIYGLDTNPAGFIFKPGTQLSVVGVPAPPTGVDVQLASAIREAREELLGLLQTHLGFGPKSIFEVPDSSEIIFYNEAGAFPINYIDEVTRLHENYSILAANEKLHITCHDRQFPDLIVLDPRQIKEHVAAAECFALGRLLGVLAPKASGGAAQYHWTEKVGINTYSRSLGDRSRALHQLLIDSGLRNPLLRESRDRLARIKSRREDLAAYFALLNFEYDRLITGEDGGKRAERDLPFDELVMAKVLRAKQEEAEQSAVAIGWPSLEAFHQAAMDASGRLDEVSTLQADGSRLMKLERTATAKAL